MKTYEIKKLMVVTAIACLPVACGTQSPTGPDATAVEGDFTASAFRYQPGDGPWAPEGGGSETAPLPVPPTNEVPAPTVPDDASTEVPDGAVPQPNRGRRPVPQPSPSDETDPGSVPTPPTVPVPPPAPAPPAGPSTETPNVGCLAVSIEIVSVSTFAGTGGLALEAILLGKDGVAITDDSCEKVLWDVDSSALGDRVTIAYGANSRHVSVSGPAGTFRIAAVTPNGLRATLDIVLQ